MTTSNSDRQEDRKSQNFIPSDIIKRRRYLSAATTVCGLIAGCEEPTGPERTSSDENPADEHGARVMGERAQWHRVTIVFNGPQSSETATPNPFLDYRLNVTFKGPSKQRYDVPGFYAGDGQGGEVGNKWCVRFAPDEVGEWQYTASFREGPGVAIAADTGAGTAAFFDDTNGTFNVLPSKKRPPDHRALGRIENRGGHYFQRPDGTRWLKGGPNVPENFMGYAGFDNSPEANKNYEVHESDWRPGDPDWGDGQGKGIIGALNFIADRGGNSIYFLPMNVGGDGDDTWPTIKKFERVRYDVSKLRQWETVLHHAQTEGIHIHFQLSETERSNEGYHDGGNLATQRKLYYRELVARFGHHNALQFNLGEEVDYSVEKLEAFAGYLTSLDPYEHPVTVHNHLGELDATFKPHLGDDSFDMTSFQTRASGDRLSELVETYRKFSSDHNHPWVVSVDETQKIEADADDKNAGLDYGRREKLWPVYMSGGGGFEWYVQHDGGGHSLDQELEDFSQIEPALRWTRNARKFIESVPYWEMRPDHDTVSKGRGYCLTDAGTTYAFYFPEGSNVAVDLSEGEYELCWFNPRTGRFKNEKQSVRGGEETNFPPSPFNRDVAATLQVVT